MCVIRPPHRCCPLVGLSPLTRAHDLAPRATPEGSPQPGAAETCMPRGTAPRTEEGREARRLQDWAPGPRSCEAHSASPGPKIRYRIEWVQEAGAGGEESRGGGGGETDQPALPPGHAHGPRSPGGPCAGLPGPMPRARRVWAWPLLSCWALSAASATSSFPCWWAPLFSCSVFTEYKVLQEQISLQKKCLEFPQTISKYLKYQNTKAIAVNTRNGKQCLSPLLMFSWRF